MRTIRPYSLSGRAASASSQPDKVWRSEPESLPDSPNFFSPVVSTRYLPVKFKFAVVDNISTVKAISDAIQTGMPLIERVATVTGEKIKNPGNFIIKIGTSVRELIDYCGGFTDEDVLVKMGGPMMGFPLNTLDVPMMKGSNGIIAIDTDETKEQPCIKCGRCVDVCPMELSPLYFVKYAKDENWQGMKDMNVMDCVECRCCQYICSSKIPIIDSIKAGKNAVRGMK